MPSTPHPAQPDQPDQRDDRRDADTEVILGVDTHKDVHAAVVISMLSVALGSRCFPTTMTGYRALLAWAQGFGSLRRVGVECTGTYGKALAPIGRGERA